MFAGEGGEGEEPPAGYQEDDGGCPEDDEDEEEEEEEGVSGGSSGSPPRSPIPSSTDGVEHNDQTVNERLPLRSVSNRIVRTIRIFFAFISFLAFSYFTQNFAFRLRFIFSPSTSIFSKYKRVFFF